MRIHLLGKNGVPYYGGGTWTGRIKTTDYQTLENLIETRPATAGFTPAYDQRNLNVL